MQKPHSILYEVFETNADLEEVRPVFWGHVKDIAESEMYKKFSAANAKIDYMLVDRTNQELIGILFSNETLAKRGECQG